MREHISHTLPNVNDRKKKVSKQTMQTHTIISLKAATATNLPHTHTNNHKMLISDLHPTPIHVVALRPAVRSVASSQPLPTRWFFG